MSVAEPFFMNDRPDVEFDLQDSAPDFIQILQKAFCLCGDGPHFFT